MASKILILLACGASMVVAQQRSRIDPRGLDFTFGTESTTKAPIPILRYLDKQNPDGSYTYGYESGDGTYKIETRYSNGEVRGKYGYYDDTGRLREVEYGADPTNGFAPKGEGLVSAEAPAQPIIQTTSAPEPVQPVEVAATRRTTVVRRPRPDKGQSRRLEVPSRRGQTSQVSSFPAQPVPVPVPAPVQSAPVFNNAERFLGHPATNIDLNTGSYSISYSGR